MGYQDKRVVLQQELKTWPFWLRLCGPMGTYNFQMTPKSGE